MIELDRDTAFASKMLDALSLRTKTAIHNIANQNVSGFKRSEVHFEDALREAQQQQGDSLDFSALQPEVVRDESGAPGQNNVVLMEELAILGKTSMLHDVLTRRAGSYYSTLNKAIFGR